MPAVTACLIVRDEERFLPRCLASLRGVVDEIVVLDTGSRDATVAIARAAGAVVGFRPWDEDFSAARNACLALATGDWALQVDADEELAPPGPGGIAGLLDEGPPCRLVEIELREGDGPGKVALQPRLFRRLEPLRYRRAIHETILDSLAEAGLPAPIPIALRLVHHGYAPDVVASRDKHRRNLRILERVRERGEADAYDLQKLAATREASGADASADWNGFLAASEAASLSLRAQWPWWPSAIAAAASRLALVGRLGRADALLREALVERPGDRRLLRTWSRIRLDAGRPEGVRMAWDARRRQESWLDPDPPGVDEAQLEARLVFVEGGIPEVRDEPAAACWTARAERRAGRIREAWSLLDRLMGTHPASPHVRELAGEWAGLEGDLATAETLFQGLPAAFEPRVRWIRSWLRWRSGIVAPPPEGAPVDLAGAIQALLLAAVGRRGLELDPLFPGRALLDGTADRLEELLRLGREDRVREFAAGAPQLERVVPGISRLVEGA